MDNGMLLSLVVLGSKYFVIYYHTTSSNTFYIQETIKSRRNCTIKLYFNAFLSRTRNGVLKIDGALEGEQQAAGQTKSIEVEPTFYLGNLLPETLQKDVVQKNVQVKKRI